MAYTEYADSTASTSSRDNLYFGWFDAAIRLAVSLTSIFLGAFGWRPSAIEHLHLDRVAAEIDVETDNRMRRYRNWLQRLGLHDLFAGFGFVDPQATGSA